METKYQEYSFFMHFDGNKEISIEALCNTLLCFQELANEASDVDCSYVIKANRIGSFETELKGFATVAVSLFTPDNVNYILKNIQTVAEWLKVKKHLKGKKPKSVVADGNNIRVENGENQIMQTNVQGAKIFENASIQNAIILMGNVIENSDRDAISILDENREAVLNIDKSSFKHIAAPINFEEIKKLRTKVRVFLAVKKADLMGNSQWQFQYDKSIYTKIEDREWLERVKKGAVVIRGRMHLEALLRIEGETKMDGTPIEGSLKYYVEKVYDEHYDLEYDDMQTAL